MTHQDYKYATYWICPQCQTEKAVFVDAREVLCVKPGAHAQRGPVRMRKTLTVASRKTGADSGHGGSRSRGAPQGGAA